MTNGSPNTKSPTYVSSGTDASPFLEAPALTNSYDQVVGAAVDEEGKLFLTLHEFGIIGEPQEGSFQRYELRVLRPEDGEQVSAASTDYVVTGFQKGRPYGYRNIPLVPQVVVF